MPKPNKRPDSALTGLLKSLISLDVCLKKAQVGKSKELSFVTKKHIK